MNAACEPAGLLVSVQVTPTMFDGAIAGVHHGINIDRLAERNVFAAGGELGV